MCSVAREAFGGDVEKFLILLVIALRTAEHRQARQIPFKQFAEGDLEALPSLYTNIGSVAEVTGIPEETVRRKVAQLRERGWVTRTDHRLAYTPKGARELAPVRAALIRVAAEVYLTVQAAQE
jgi:DNA-binding MarR family transcriptional regulator